MAERIRNMIRNAKIPPKQAAEEVRIEVKEENRWSEKASYKERKWKIEDKKEYLLEKFEEGSYSELIEIARKIVDSQHKMRDIILEYHLLDLTQEQQTEFKKNMANPALRSLSAKTERIIKNWQKDFLDIATWEWQGKKQAERQKRYRERKQEKSGLPKRPRGRPRKTDA